MLIRMNLTCKRSVYGIMSIEAIYFVWYSILFGFLGSLLANWGICNFFRMTGVDDLKFNFPLDVFLLFVIFDLMVGIFFAMYSCIKISKLSIINSIRE